MALSAAQQAYLPVCVRVDGRLGSYVSDANVGVWPVGNYSEYQLNESAAVSRAATTITKAPDAFVTGQPVPVEWNGVWWLIPYNTSVTVPLQVFDILTVAGSQYTVS